MARETFPPLLPFYSVVKDLLCKDFHLGNTFHNFDYRGLVYAKYLHIILLCLFDPVSSSLFVLEIF